VLELFADGPHQNRAHERLRAKENIEQETPNCNIAVSNFSPLTPPRSSGRRFVW
jgi:hypothetical protein